MDLSPPAPAKVIRLNTRIAMYTLLLIPSGISRVRAGLSKLDSTADYHCKQLHYASDYTYYHFNYY